MHERTTVIATQETFDRLFPSAMREEFWQLVGETLEQVFHIDRSRAIEYRNVIDTPVTGPHTAPAGERIAVYHSSALSVAADLAGWRKPIADKMLEKFLELQRAYASRLGIELPRGESDSLLAS